MGQAGHQLSLSGEFEPEVILGRRLRRRATVASGLPDGLPFSLRVLGSIQGVPIAMVEAPLGRGIPAYAERRRWRTMVDAPMGGGVLVFTDAPHSAFVWSWPDQSIRGPRRYRECVVPGGEDMLARESWRPAASGSVVSDEPVSSAADDSSLLTALGLVLRAGLLRDSGSAGDWQAYIEEISTLEEVRRFWRRLVRTRILDRSGDVSGVRLIEAARTLQWIYVSTLERIGAFVIDSHLADDRRPEFIRDLKMLLRSAREMDRARRMDCGASFSSLLIFQRNLYAVVEGEPGRRKLLAAFRREFPSLDPTLRILDTNIITRREFEAWRDMTSPGSPGGDSEIDDHDLAEEVEVLRFAWMRVREMRSMGVSTRAELQRAAAGISGRRTSLIRRVARISRSTPLAPALRRCGSSLYFEGVSRYRDFDITLAAG